MARNQRSHLELPVIVCGRSPNEEPLHEEARTLVVYSCGALIALDATVELGQELVLVNPKTKAEAACHVVGIESSKSGCRIAVSKKVSPGTLVVILSGAASTVPQDARRAATAVLLKDKSMPRLMHSVDGFLEDKLQKT